MQRSEETGGEMKESNSTVQTAPFCSVEDTVLVAQRCRLLPLVVSFVSSSSPLSDLSLSRDSLPRALHHACGNKPTSLCVLHAVPVWDGGVEERIHLVI